METLTDEQRRLMEGKEKKCPMSFNCPEGMSLLVCQKNECAWWDEDNKKCAILKVVIPIKSRAKE